MVEWLKYFFLSFFSNKIAKNGIKRSLSNAVLSMLLAFVIICLGLFVGYISTFGYHYSRSDDYRSFMYSAFAEGPNRINLSISGGKIYATFPDGGEYVNTAEDSASAYKKNGYELFVDNRSLATYVEFTIAAKSNKEGEADISYDEYAALDDAQKKDYKLTITASCNKLDIKANFSTYTEYLDAVSDEDNEAYDKDVAEKYAEIKKANSETDKISDDEYNGIYELYVKSRYSEYDFSQRNVPALDWYYADYYIANVGNRFAMLFSDGCILSFDSSTKLSFVIFETYEKVGNFTVSDQSMSESTARANVDKLMSTLFASGYTNAFFTCLIEMARVIVYYFIGILVFSLILYFVAKKLKCRLLPSAADSLKLVGSFMVIPSLISFLASLICSLFMSHSGVFILAGILFVVIMAVRTLVLFVPEVIRDMKLRKELGDSYDENGDEEYAE